ncbi:MAG: GatB/YqeY domain-containing protein [Candidatus Omnitrophica bacterium]|nr:GatB/YqeY domain-containing protein [Candidatus Omnitrophota bacterium]
MTLAQKINDDLKTAMKAGDSAKVSTLRMLKAAVSNLAIQKGKTDLEDGEIQEVIQKSLKQHQESVEAFTKGNRPELAQKEAHEAKLLKEYLPPSMDAGELKALIQATIKELGVSGPSALGQVMKAVLPKVKGRADGREVSQLVSQLL